MARKVSLNQFVKRLEYMIRHGDISKSRAIRVLNGKLLASRKNKKQAIKNEEKILKEKKRLMGIKKTKKRKRKRVKK